MMQHSLKSMIFGLGLACFGTVASAAEIAAFDFSGDFQTSNNPFAVVVEDGRFSASFDDSFDANQTNDFLLEADFFLNGHAILSEDFLVQDLTGQELLFGAFITLLQIDDLLDGAIGKIVDEAFDGDLAQTDIGGNAFLGLDFDITDLSLSSIAGNFDAILSEGLFDPNYYDPTFGGTFAANFSVSTVAPVPLPATSLLLLGGLGGLAALRRRRKA